MKIAIIGTRVPTTPQKALCMAAVSYHSDQGDTIATGGASGIDALAMEWADRLQVFVPWKGFQIKTIPLRAEVIVYDPTVHHAWTESVFKFHPAPGRLTPISLKLHARNYGIIENSSLVWAFPRPDGEGGTGQGIRIAKSLKIPLVVYQGAASEWAYTHMTTDMLEICREIVAKSGLKGLREVQGDPTVEVVGISA